jgi:hypothetical protein
LCGYTLSMSSIEYHPKRTTTVLVPPNRGRLTISTRPCNERSRRFKRRVHDKIATRKSLFFLHAGDSEAVRLDRLYVMYFPALSVAPTILPQLSEFSVNACVTRCFSTRWVTGDCDWIATRPANQGHQGTPSFDVQDSACRVPRDMDFGGLFSG